MYLENEDLIIRNATPGDSATLGNWWRDGRVMEHAGFPNGLSITDEEIAESILKDTDQTGRRLIMELDHVPIGEMNYRNIGSGTVEIGIKICNFDRQEKGIGTQLLMMFIKALFCEYGYSRIILDTNLNNVRAQHVYEKLGFRRIKVNVDSWKNQIGEPQSSVDYEMTEADFEKLYQLLP